MAKRSYQQNCALAQACDVIGERWTLLLIRDLIVGPRRFRELMKSLKGMGTNLLTARLKELQNEGLIEHNQSNAYILTERGIALEPVLFALIRWTMANRPQPYQGSHHMDEWDLVALKALFQPNQAKDLSVRIQFKTDQFYAWTVIDKQEMTLGIGEIDQTDITVNGTISDLFVKSKSLDEISFSGSKKTLNNYIAAFGLPT